MSKKSIRYTKLTQLLEALSKGQTYATCTHKVWFDEHKLKAITDRIHDMLIDEGIHPMRAEPIHNPFFKQGNPS